jgi:hypothetical protein
MLFYDFAARHVGLLKNITICILAHTAEITLRQIKESTVSAYALLTFNPRIVY